MPSRMGEVIRELELRVDGHYLVRIYGAALRGEWEAWLEFTSLARGNLSRTDIFHTERTREDLARWAADLDSDQLHRALEDAELASASDLGRTPPQASRRVPTR